MDSRYDPGHTADFHVIHDNAECYCYYCLLFNKFKLCVEEEEKVEVGESAICKIYFSFFKYSDVM